MTTVNVRVIKEKIFSFIFSVAMKTEKDYYNRFRIPDVFFVVEVFSSVSCDEFFFCNRTQEK